MSTALATVPNFKNLVPHLAPVEAKEAPPVSPAHIPSEIIAPVVKESPPKKSLAQKLAVPIL